MAKSVAFVQVIALVMICMLANNNNNNNRAEGKEGFSCGVVNNSLFRCLEYLETGQHLTGECCDGFQQLVNEAKTRADRRTACFCFMNLKFSDEVFKRAAQIPIACDIKPPFVISHDTKCSQID